MFFCLLNTLKFYKFQECNKLINTINSKEHLKFILNLISIFFYQVNTLNFYQLLVLQDWYFKFYIFYFKKFISYLKYILKMLRVYLFRVYLFIFQCQHSTYFSSKKLFTHFAFIFMNIFTVLLFFIFLMIIIHYLNEYDLKVISHN